MLVSRKHRLPIVVCIGAVSLSSVTLHAQSGSVQRVSNFAKGTAGWKSVRINKKIPATKFRAKIIQGVSAVEAYAHKSMALFARPVEVNLARTPILCWRWRVSNVVKTANITKKSGDDQAARIYIGLNLPNASIPIGTRAKLALARVRGTGWCHQLCMGQPLCCGDGAQ